MICLVQDKIQDAVDERVSRFRAELERAVEDWKSRREAHKRRWPDSFVETYGEGDTSIISSILSFGEE